VAQRLPTIAADRAFVGTWITDEEDSNAAFVFSTRSGKFHVSGFCRSNGEEFEITRVRRHGDSLSFIARMPSTAYVTKNVFRIRPDGKLHLELTTSEVWKKKDVKPGEIPEAWRRVSGGLAPRAKVRRSPMCRKGQVLTQTRKSMRSGSSGIQKPVAK
jgi:hypothetical protein